MSGNHAFLPPSGAAIWLKCAAAPSMWQRYPEPEDSLEAMEGTAAHWAFEELFAGRQIDIGLVAPNGIVLTDEMCDGAQLFYDTVMTACGTNYPGDIIVEETISIPSIHADNWGTPDAYYLQNSTLTIQLFDFKFGHDYVEEYENWQLIDYAAGLLDKYHVDGEADQWTTLELYIVQPRCYGHDPVRRLTVRASELRGHINKLRMAADAAHEPNPAATVNPKCKHCSGRHACQPYQRSALEAADLSMRSAPLDLTPEQTGKELAMLQRARAALEGRISGLEESAFAMIQQGHRVPPYHVEYGQGRTTWAKPADEVRILASMFGVKVDKEALITPKQAQDAGLPADVLKEYAYTPSGKPKLVQDAPNELLKSFK
jgi:hypothetical protein